MSDSSDSGGSPRRLIIVENEEEITGDKRHQPEDGHSDSDRSPIRQRVSEPIAIERRAFFVPWGTMLKPLSLSDAFILEAIFPEYAYYGQNRLVVNDKLRNYILQNKPANVADEAALNALYFKLHEKINRHCRQVIFQVSFFTTTDALLFIGFKNLQSAVIKLTDTCNARPLPDNQELINPLLYLFTHLKLENNSKAELRLVNRKLGGYGAMYEERMIHNRPVLRLKLYPELLTRQFQTRFSNFLRSCQLWIIDTVIPNLTIPHLRQYRALFSDEPSFAFLANLLTTHASTLEKLTVQARCVTMNCLDLVTQLRQVFERPNARLTALKVLALDFNLVPPADIQTDCQRPNEVLFAAEWKKLCEKLPDVLRGSAGLGKLSIGWTTNPVNCGLTLSQLTNGLISERCLPYFRLKIGAFLPIDFSAKMVITLEIVFSYLKKEAKKLTNDREKLSNMKPVLSSEPHLVNGFFNVNSADSLVLSTFGPTVQMLKLKYCPDFALPFAKNLGVAFRNLTKLYLNGFHAHAYCHATQNKDTFWGSLDNGLLELLRLCPRLHVIKLVDAFEKPDLYRSLLEFINRAKKEENQTFKFVFYADGINSDHQLVKQLVKRSGSLKNCRLFLYNFSKGRQNQNRAPTVPLFFAENHPFWRQRPRNI